MNSAQKDIVNQYSYRIIEALRHTGTDDAVTWLCNEGYLSRHARDWVLSEQTILNRTTCVLDVLSVADDGWLGLMKFLKTNNHERLVANMESALTHADGHANRLRVPADLAKSTTAQHQPLSSTALVTTEEQMKECLKRTDVRGILLDRLDVEHLVHYLSKIDGRSRQNLAHPYGIYSPREKVSRLLDHISREKGALKEFFEILQKMQPYLYEEIMECGGLNRKVDIGSTSVRQPQPMSCTLSVRKPPDSRTNAGSCLKLNREIGSGAYGFVLEVVDDDGCTSALKMIPVISDEHERDTSKPLHELQYVHHSSTFVYEKQSNEDWNSMEMSSETQFTNAATSSYSANKIPAKNVINNENKWIIESSPSAKSLPAKQDGRENESDIGNEIDRGGEEEDEAEEFDCEKMAKREAFFHHLNSNNECENIVHSIDQWVTIIPTKSEFCAYRDKMRAMLKVKCEDEPSSCIQHYAKEHNRITVYMLQMQLYPMGSLHNWLDTNKGLFSDTYGDRVCILRGTLRGLEYIHRHGVMHRDLCPSNVLLEECKGKIIAKISDFGTAVSCGAIRDWKLTKTRHAHTRSLGTNPYSAPEVDTDSYNEQCDLYSFGMMVVKTMWNVHTDQDLVQMRNNLWANKADKLLHNAKLPRNAKDWLDLIKSVVTTDYEIRPSCKSLLQNKLFSEESDGYHCSASTSFA